MNAHQKIRRFRYEKVLCLAVALGAFCVLIAGASAAKDDYVNYDKRLPGFGAHITLVQSTKKSDTSHAINSPGNCDVKFICWIDAYISKTWLPMTSNYTAYSNKSILMLYQEAIPRDGTPVRLRSQAVSIFGGERVVGEIDFR